MREVCSKLMLVPVKDQTRPRISVNLRIGTTKVVLTADKEATNTEGLLHWWLDRHSSAKITIFCISIDKFVTNTIIDSEYEDLFTIERMQIVFPKP